MLFPMYTVAADKVLQMTRIDPHEELKAGNVWPILGASGSGFRV